MSCRITLNLNEETRFIIILCNLTLCYLNTRDQIIKNVFVLLVRVKFREIKVKKNQQVNPFPHFRLLLHSAKRTLIHFLDKTFLVDRPDFTPKDVCPKEIFSQINHLVDSTSDRTNTNENFSPYINKIA